MNVAGAPAGARTVGRQAAARPAGRALGPALAAALAAIAAAGCSTPPADHFHTLRSARPPGGTPVSHQAAGLLAIGPVTVPAELARSEWVIRDGATGATIYEHQLWTQDLSADIAQALADRLDGAGLADGLWADAGPGGAGTGADLDQPAPLRLRVQVLRFDSLLSPAPAVRDQIRWTLECLPSDADPSPVGAGRYRVLRTAVREASGEAPAAEGGVPSGQQRFDRLALAHAATLRQLAQDAAAALRDSSADRARLCAPAAPR